MGLYEEAFPDGNRSKKVLMFHNITSQQYKRITKIEKDWKRKIRAWLNGVSMGYWEPRYAGKFDCSTTVSEEDRNLLLDANPNLKVSVIPNGVDVAKLSRLPASPKNDPLSLLFIGNMGYPSCADAVCLFL